MLFFQLLRNGPLGPYGVLSTKSNLPNRFQGTIASSSTVSSIFNIFDSFSYRIQITGAVHQPPLLIHFASMVHTGR